MNVGSAVPSMTTQVLNNMPLKIPFDEDLEYFESLAKDNFKHTIFSLPKESFSSMAKRYDPAMTDEEVEKLFKYVKLQKLNDPFAPLQPLKPGKDNFQLQQISSGGNLELGLFLAQITGSYLYTDMNQTWEGILSTIDQSNNSANSTVWSPLTKAFQKLDFRFLNAVDADFACDIRKEERLRQFRNFLRKIWKNIDGSPAPEKANILAREFSDELLDEYKKAEVEWSKIDQDLSKWLATTALSTSLLPSILGKMNYEIPLIGFGLNSITQIILAKVRKRNFRRKIPMSVFLDLRKYYKKYA